MTKRRCLQLPAVIALIGVVARPVQAAVDLTGSWYVDLTNVSPPVYFKTIPISIVQTGSSLTWTLIPSGDTIFTGTIDVNTGAFTVTGGFCTAFVDTLTGTAALDSSGFTAIGPLHYEELNCTSVIAPNTQATGVRGACGDNVVTAAGETCDDGNTTDGDCCSSTCDFELSGSFCTDGNPLTCEACNGSGTCQGSVCPAFDVSGAWVFPSFFFGQVFCLQFAQNGIGLSATPCETGTPFDDGPMVGTIDPSTRQFSLTQPPETCQPPFRGAYCTLDGTFTADFSSWSGGWWCRNLDVTPPYPCEGAGDSATAVREFCGDYFVFSASGEQCDDGNTPNDCCSPTCQFESANTPCSFGPTSCGACDATGTCQQTTCPFTLDHYQCYGGRDLRSPPFARRTVDTADQLTNEQIIADKLKYVCAPVNKNGEGINDPSAHLACYQVSAANLEPRPQVEISSQFQMSRFELKRPRLMCLPATKVVLP